MSPQYSAVPRIVIVGGGAGGLELATRLGDTLGKRGLAEITLIDVSLTHVWKPLLHEIAAGSMDIDRHALDYSAQAYWHHFKFRLGAMDGLDRKTKEVLIAPGRDADGVEVTPRRRFRYDQLVIAVGSLANDFGTPGAKEHAISLDTAEQAERFHRTLIRAYFRAESQTEPLRPGQLGLVIVGGGATGVELAAELHNTVRELASYGLENISPDKHMKITLIEAGPRILAALPERLSKAALELLGRLEVKVLTGEFVTEVAADGVRTQSGRFFPAELTVWAAGIKAPDFLRDLGGLETNRLNQLVVVPTLQTTRDPDIFAFGDCASCPWPGHDGAIPPRAQAAHQQASLLVKSLRSRLRGKPPPLFHYRDFGSLVSLGEYSTIGALMTALSRGSLVVEGYFARLMYLSLYKMHLLALHGFVKMVLDTIVRFITRRTEPQVKLH